MIRHKDLEIDKDNPFINCKLNRKQYADVLTQIVSSYKDGFVLAINNKWGTGKTTFVRMWEKQLLNESYKTVYFNAWENDFEDNALTALMGELSTLVDTTTKENFKEVLQKGAVIAKNILPGVIKAAVGNYINIKELQDFAEAATKGMTEIFEEDVKEYSKKKESIKEFKHKLQKFISDTTEDKPLIFIVDELDRCRPNYAVSVLEQIKHFFSVPGIVFVLSIDKEQLGHAVKGVYGNDNIDADDYLRRFIDLEYNIPEPNTDQYCDYLFEYFKFSEFFSSEERNGYREFQHDSNSFIRVAKLLFNSKKITLRQQQKIFGHARLVLKSFALDQYTFPMLYIYLIYLKVLYPDIFKSISNKQLSITQLQDEFLKTINYTNVSIEDKANLTRIEGYLVYFSYYYLTNQKNVPNLINYNAEGKSSCIIKSKIDNESAEFNSFIDNLDSRFSHEVDIEYLIKRIDLTEAVNIN